MEPGKKRVLTEAQEKVLDDGAASLAAALDQVRARLSAAGLHFPPDDEGGEGSFACKRCDCAQFKQPTRPGLSCARRTCHHSFILHFAQ